MTARRSAKNIRVAELVANPLNVRDSLGDVTELTRAIGEHGVLEPLLVTEDPQHRGWILLAGHRRLAAARQAGLLAVPCFVHHDLGKDEQLQVVMMLVENVQRTNLTPMEKARAYGRLRDSGLTPSQIARRTGIHVSTIHTHLALLDVDEETTERVETGDLAAGVAIAAVREKRQAERIQNGTPARGRPVVDEPAYLNWQHPLALAVANLCDHTRRPAIGSTKHRKGPGCGQCWERVICDTALDASREVSA
ncbi:MAG: parB-like partition protein [Nocardioidaceae bacterium]|nr:parB-like partition protein [Nocardioidaceae bacterium]